MHRMFNEVGRGGGELEGFMNPGVGVVCFLRVTPVVTLRQESVLRDASQQDEFDWKTACRTSKGSQPCRVSWRGIRLPPHAVHGGTSFFSPQGCTTLQRCIASLRRPEVVQQEQCFSQDKSRSGQSRDRPAQDTKEGLSRRARVGWPQSQPSRLGCTRRHRADRRL